MKTSGIITLPPALTPPITGTFLYGAKKELRETAPFQAGVYPVTNAQFAQFIQAGGYAESKWWSDAGWQWRQWPPRYSWQKLDRPDFGDDKRFNQPDQPDGSAWHAARMAAYIPGAIVGKMGWRIPLRAARSEPAP